MGPDAKVPQMTPHFMSRLPTLLIELAGAGLVLALGALLMLGGARQGPRAAGAPTTPVMEDLQPCIMDRSGYIHGRLYGALKMTVDWTGSMLACGGMSRPNEKGVRLVFASPPQSQSKRRIFVIGIDRTVDGLTRGEAAVNLTLIDEKSGRFFGTRGTDRCWTQVSAVKKIVNAPETYRIDGDMYCAGSIPSLSDTASVTLSDFHYSGRLTLDES